ncbi:MAG: flagellar hook-length control protein FliK [Vampirovibrionales bacterium]|nr:flagellar hook-length control protein FliK [Vampirovibrionales bacterium]
MTRASDKRADAISASAESAAAAAATTTTTTASPTRTAAARQASAPGDGVDLRFLDLLVDLSATRVNRGALSLLNGAPSSDADAAGAAADKERKQAAAAAAEDAAKQAAKLTAAAATVAPAASALRDTDASPVEGSRRALSALNGDLTRQDVRVMDQLTITAMAYPGGVPLQQAFALTPGGKPDFARAGLSERFANLMEKAYSENRSVRVELDSRSSLILRFHEGKVSAEFLTQDQAMAHYLRQTMDDLRQRLADRQLPVSTLTFRQPDARDDGRPPRDSGEDGVSDA